MDASPNEALVPAAPTSPSNSPMPSQADDDGHLLELWLHGKSPNTREAYRRDLFQFIDFVDKPLQRIRLDDLQAWDRDLHSSGLATSTRARKLAAVKSLFSFGHRLGYLLYNIGGALPVPKVPNQLAERILPEEAVQRILALEPGRRNAVLLRLFYATGGRVSELAGLYWRAVQERTTNGVRKGQVTLLGKGDKTRSVLVSSETWAALLELRRAERIEGFGSADDPVFRSQKTDGPLSRSQLWRIVRKAAERAGLKEAVSPHWLRHAHASHALDRGAPAHLVKETLGHESLATTSKYTHARPDDSSAQYLPV